MPAEVSPATRSAEWHIFLLGQIQEHMPPTVGQGEQLAALEPGDQFRLRESRFDTQFGAGHDAQRHMLLVEHALERLGLRPDRVAMIGEHAKLMRRGHDGRNTIGRCQAGHRQGFRAIGGTIVDCRENMAVNVDQRHAFSLLRRSVPPSPTLRQPFLPS